MTITTEPIQKPQTDWRDEDYYAALRWVNEQRVNRFGLEPLDDLPCGEPSNGQRCVVANSLPGVEWCAPIFGVKFVSGAPIASLPREVQRLMSKHGAGHYPALLEN